MNKKRLRYLDSESKLDEIYLIARKSGQTTYYVQGLKSWYNKAQNDTSWAENAIYFNTKEDAELFLENVKQLKAKSSHVHRYKIEKVSKHFYTTWNVKFWPKDYECTKAKPTKMCKILRPILNRYGQKQHIEIITPKQAIILAKKNFLKYKESERKYYESQLITINENIKHLDTLPEIINDIDVTEFEKQMSKTDKTMSLLYAKKQ